MDLAATARTTDASVGHDWPPPFLLYIGNAPDLLAAKVANGLLKWRPQDCPAQLRGPQCQVDLGLPQWSPAEAVAQGCRTMIVGVANAGGMMDAYTVATVIEALEAGLNVASGLHDRLRGHPDILAAAARTGRSLFDARQPPETGVGKGRKRAGKRLLTVGTDCSTGKMFTTLALARELQARGVPSDFRATGQTGIFISGAGIPIDAVVSDFISGGIEWLSPAREDGGWDLIEGQGSLFHASFAGVSLGLLHGAQPDAIVLCHEPGRAHMRGLPHYPLPALEEALEANLAAARLTNPQVRAVGIALNTSAMAREQAQALCAELAARFDLPVVDPLLDGVGAIADRMLA